MRRDCNYICEHLLGEKHTKISVCLQTPVNCLPSRLYTWINNKHSAGSWLDELSVCMCTVLLQKEHLVLYSVSQAKAWTAGLKSLERGAAVLSWGGCGGIRVWHLLLGMLQNIQGKRRAFVEGFFVVCVAWFFFFSFCIFGNLAVDLRVV